VPHLPAISCLGAFPTPASERVARFAIAGVRKPAQNLTYQNLSPAGQAAIKTFLGNAETLAPLAYALQGYRYNRVIFDATVARLSQAIVGQLTLGQAYARITDDIKQAMAAMRQ